MITAILKSALSIAGCTSVLYESEQLKGIITDEVLQTDIVGLILQPQSMTFEVKANSVYNHYGSITVEIMAQVKPEDTAENNAALWETLTENCRKFILVLTGTESFKKIGNVSADKIEENRYDANLVGWALHLDLFPLENIQNC
jgi:hypothetical protein